MKFITQAEAETYDRWYETPLGHWVDWYEKKAVESLLPPLAGLKVLDAGCGTGNFTLDLARQGAHLLGMDRSAAMLALARGKACNLGLDIRWVQGDLLHVPLGSASVDGVVSILALEFIPCRATAFQELTRVLRPGGFLVVAILNRYSLWTLERLITSSAWRQVKFLRPRDLTGLVEQTGAFEHLRWRRAVYVPPLQQPWIVRRAPAWERLGACLAPGCAAFFALAARKKASPIRV
jgi:ubiquinone/menaquinone biosynthesis C-methylase UbiE